MRALSFTLVAASLLLAGCLGLGGSEQAPAEANPASSQDEPNATNTSTNASTPATEPTGPAYAGYTPPGTRA